MSVRETKKERTRTALADAAVELFTARGYDAVTMAEVAALAGVSRRTAFRYFDGKGDLTSVYPDRWREVFDVAVAEHAQKPTSARLREAAFAIAAHIEADPKPVQQLLSLASAHQALAARYAASSRGWVERVVVEILGSEGTEDSEGTEGTERTQNKSEMLVAGVLASAYMGMVDTACAIWAESGGSLRELLEEGFAALERGLSALD